MSATLGALVRMIQTKIQGPFQPQSRIIKAEDESYPSDAELPMKIVILDNNIAKANYKLANEIPINMSNSENMDYGNDWRTYRDKNDYLGKNSGQAY